MSTPDTTDSPEVVVAGVDGSANSRAALAWAAEEASHRRCALHVITAWSLPTPRTGGRAAPPSYTPEASTYQEQARQLVEREKDAVLGENGSATCSSIRGRPLGVLLEAGRSARMLVVGSRGSRLRFGSVCDQLVRQAPCPVLVVPAHRQRAGT